MQARQLAFHHLLGRHSLTPSWQSRGEVPNGDTADIHPNSTDTDQWTWHLVHLLFELLLKTQRRKSQQILQHNVLLVFVKYTLAVCLSIMVSHSLLGCRGSGEEVSLQTRSLCKLGITAHFCLSHRVRSAAEGKNGGLREEEQN